MIKKFLPHERNPDSAKRPNKNTLKNIKGRLLLQNALFGGFLAIIAMTTTAKPVQAETGFYLKPEIEMVFVPKDFSRGNGKIQLGGGGGLSLGYQLDAWQFELSNAYHYVGSSGNGVKWQKTNGDPVTSTANFNQFFIPISAGINYTFPFLANIDTTVGFGGGVLINIVNNVYKGNLNVTDKTTSYVGIMTPKVSLDYLVTDNLTLSLVGRFYIAPSGFNDFYSDAAKAEAKKLDLKTQTEQNFWYGGLNLTAAYRF